SELKTQIRSLIAVSRLPSPVSRLPSPVSESRSLGVSTRKLILHDYLTLLEGVWQKSYSL
ncbi:MAG: hypothetical protein ACKPH1_22445, partial [Microcystis panniformis]